MTPALRYALALVLVAVALATAAPASAAPGPTRMERAVLAAVNRERAARGLPPLHRSRVLARGARLQTAWILRTGSFGHRGLAAGTSEALGLASGRLATARDFVRRWLRSPAHRALILRRGARFAGVGSRTGRYRGARVRLVAIRLR